jgi:hypothetical protein
LKFTVTEIRHYYHNLELPEARVYPKPQFLSNPICFASGTNTPWSAREFSTK